MRGSSVWLHTRKGDKHVTVTIDLTPIRDKTSLSRLLDMAPGRSKHAFKQWLTDRPRAWCDQVEVVAMDGFTVFKTATTEELPDAVPVIDPFLPGSDACASPPTVGPALSTSPGTPSTGAGNASNTTRAGHRGRAWDPLYTARWTRIPARIWSPRNNNTG